MSFKEKKVKDQELVRKKVQDQENNEMNVFIGTIAFFTFIVF